MLHRRAHGHAGRHPVFDDAARQADESCDDQRRQVIVAAVVREIDRRGQGPLERGERLHELCGRTTPHEQRRIAKRLHEERGGFGEQFSRCHFQQRGGEFTAARPDSAAGSDPRPGRPQLPDRGGETIAAGWPE